MEEKEHDLVFKVGFKMERKKKSQLVAIKWAKAHVVFLEQGLQLPLRYI